MTGYAYDTALGMLDRGHYVLCIPGTIDGEPVVYTRGYVVPAGAEPYVLSRDRTVRAAFAWGALIVARQGAEHAGVTL